MTQPLPNYYLYRISSRYDGFLPSRLPERSRQDVLAYNWSAYLENLAPRDVVLTYFTGPGCRDGIYAICPVRKVNVLERTENVTALILAASHDDRSPLIPVRGNRALFDHIRTRPRGAEIVVPESAEREVYKALRKVSGLLQIAKKHGIVLPGAEPVPVQSVADVPWIDLESDVSRRILNRGPVAVFWVRPRQASWMSHCPKWLRYITAAFSKFKGGDMSRVKEFADALAGRSDEALRRDGVHAGVVVSVPLNGAKRNAREVNRVRELATCMATSLGVPYTPALELTGDISRRLYKLRGKTAAEFGADYLASLEVRVTEELLECVARSRAILLVDDVYTDGVTTSVVAQALRKALEPTAARIQVATLGLMAKVRNMARKLADSWR